MLDGVGMLGFGLVVDAGELRRGFERIFGAARVVIAVAGRSRSWVFWVRCWVGCVGDGSGGVSAFGWPRVVGVWDVAVAAAAAV